MDPLSQFASQDQAAVPASSSAHSQLDNNRNPFAEGSSSNNNGENLFMTTKNHALGLGNVQEEPLTTAENGGGSDGEALGDSQSRQQHENDIVSSSREITQQALEGMPPATSEVFNLNSYDLNKSTEDLLAEQEAALV